MFGEHKDDPCVCGWSSKQDIEDFFHEYKYYVNLYQKEHGLPLMSDRSLFKWLKNKRDSNMALSREATISDFLEEVEKEIINGELKYKDAPHQFKERISRKEMEQKLAKNTKKWYEEFMYDE